MRKERYKLIGILLYTVLWLVLGAVGYIETSDPELLVMLIVLAMLPYGLCILSKNKKYTSDKYEINDIVYTKFSFFVFLVKLFVGAFIGPIAFLPMLYILIMNEKKENEDFSKRRACLEKQLEVINKNTSGLKQQFLDIYLPVIEKYPICVEPSKEVFESLFDAVELYKKLIHIQLYEGEIFYAGLISTLWVNLRLKRIYNQISKVMLKTSNYFKLMSNYDYLEDDDDILCKWGDEVYLYISALDKAVEESKWLIYKHQDMFRFFVKRDFVIVGIIAFFCFVYTVSS